jgi:hypothetical protein
MTTHAPTPAALGLVVEGLLEDGAGGGDVRLRPHSGALVEEVESAGAASGRVHVEGLGLDEPLQELLVQLLLVLGEGLMVVSVGLVWFGLDWIGLIDTLI